MRFSPFNPRAKATQNRNSHKENLSVFLLVTDVISHERFVLTVDPIK